MTDTEKVGNDVDLDAVRDHFDRARRFVGSYRYGMESANDVPGLVAEINRLRAQVEYLNAAIKWKDRLLEDIARDCEAAEARLRELAEDSDD